jgi:hypothetical protein
MTKPKGCVVCYRPETVKHAIHKMLCASCNKALGLLQEDPLRVLNMARYLVLHLNEEEER